MSCGLEPLQVHNPGAKIHSELGGQGGCDQCQENRAIKLWEVDDAPVSFFLVWAFKKKQKKP